MICPIHVGKYVLGDVSADALLGLCNLPVDEKISFGPATQGVCPLLPDNSHMTNHMKRGPRTVRNVANMSVGGTLDYDGQTVKDRFILTPVCYV